MQAATPGQRRALLRVHRAQGYCAWALGIMALATGVQEKRTFSLGDDMYAPSVQIGGLILLAIAATFVATTLTVLIPVFQAAAGADRAGKKGLLDEEGNSA